MCLFTCVGYTVYTSPSPGCIENPELDCVHSKKNNLTKPEFVWRKTLKNSFIR